MTSTLKRPHQFPRRRFKWAIGLGLIFGVVGALLGVWSQHPLYKSTVLLVFPMTVFNPNSPQDTLIVDYGEFVRWQMTVMSSKEQIERALELPQWKELGRPVTDAVIDQFSDNLEVQQPNGSIEVQVSYSDPDPKAAQAGANVICDAYVSYLSTADPHGTQRRYEYWDRKRTTVGAELAAANLNLSKLAELYGTLEIGPLLEEDLLDTNRLRHDYDTQSSELDAALAIARNQPPGAPATVRAILTNEQIAASDPTMASLLQERQQRELVLDQTLAEFGSQHIEVRAARESLDSVNRQIQQRNAEFNQLSTGTGAASGPGSSIVTHPLTPADVEQMSVRVNHLKYLLAKQQSDTETLGRLNTTITEEKAHVASLTAQLDEVNRWVEQFSSALPAENRVDQIAIYSRGKVPTDPASDRRATMGAIGFVSGGLLPAAVLILLGLLGRLFRHSAESAGESSGSPASDSP
jgi:capsular polysaccharide biosynthesis protein